VSDPKSRRRPRLIGVVILAAIALISLSVIASLSLDKGDTNPIRIEGAGEVQKLFGGIRQDGNELGSDQAPVQMQVLNDLQCARCADWQLDNIDPLIEQYVRSGDVQLQFHHYALGDRAAGVAYYGAVAAGIQGKQWQFIDLFFINQDEAKRRGVTEELLDDIAGAILEFNVEQWQQDFDDRQVKDDVDADAEYTARLELTADPAVILDGPGGSRTLEDAPTFDQIAAAIDEVRG
jgi:protein-disulfide isomerase